MAFLQCHVHSQVLKQAISLDVILPAAASRDDVPEQGWPVMYLLHGLSDDHSAWWRWTSIERYVRERRLAVVMPNVHRSFYTDMVAGPDFFSFVTEELPLMMHGMFHLSQRREDTFAAGLSMGGYGAFKLGLAHPQRYAAVASLSGALDIVRTHQEREDLKVEAQWIFGGMDAVADTPNDLFYLARLVAANDGPKPLLFQCCGTDDYLHPGNVNFRELARELGLDLTYEEEPGDHNWAYWDMKIQRVLEWLPLPEDEG